MSIEAPQSERQEQYPHNLLTNFDDTLAAMELVEGQAWLNQQKRRLERHEDLDDTVFGALRNLTRLQEIKSKNPTGTMANMSEKRIFYTIHGDGGATRWVVRGNGDVEFSGFHDQVGRREKTEKARSLGFKIEGSITG